MKGLFFSRDPVLGIIPIECICNRVLDKFLGKTNWVLDVESGGASRVISVFMSEVY